MEEEGHDIAGDELELLAWLERGGNGPYNSGIRFWGDAAVLWPKRIHDPTQAEIDAARHECWCNGETHDLHQKPGILPLVLPAHDAACVANDLEDNAGGHRKMERCSSSSEAVGDGEAEE